MKWTFKLKLKSKQTTKNTQKMDNNNNNNNNPTPRSTFFGGSSTPMYRPSTAAAVSTPLFGVQPSRPLTTTRQQLLLPDASSSMFASSSSSMVAQPFFVQPSMKTWFVGRKLSRVRWFPRCVPPNTFASSCIFIMNYYRCIIIIYGCLKHQSFFFGQRLFVGYFW